jgi:hypothetical protein
MRERVRHLVRHYLSCILTQLSSFHFTRCFALCSYSPGKPGVKQGGEEGEEKVRRKVRMDGQEVKRNKLLCNFLVPNKVAILTSFDRRFAPPRRTLTLCLRRKQSTP